MEKKDWRTKIGSILNNNRVDILDKDGSELLNDLEELFNQELDKAREEGRKEQQKLDCELYGTAVATDKEVEEMWKSKLKRMRAKAKEELSKLVK